MYPSTFFSSFTITYLTELGSYLRRMVRKEKRNLTAVFLPLTESHVYLSTEMSKRKELEDSFIVKNKFSISHVKKNIPEVKYLIEMYFRFMLVTNVIIAQNIS